MTTYSATIYETPDNWGETIYADYETMLNVVESLIDAGGDDWADCNIADCDKWTFVKEINGHGLYEEAHTGTPNYIAFDVNGGYYEMVRLASMFGSRVAQYNSVEEADEDLS